MLAKVIDEATLRISNFKEENSQMLKRSLTSAVMASLLAVIIPFSAGTAEAQSRYCTCRTTHHRTARRTSRYRRSGSSYSNGYTNTRYAYANNYTAARRPNVYQRHRRLFNTAFGAGAGALVGGLLGGRRGAGLGLLAGGVGSQVFTHYQRPKNYTRYRRY
jgi:hypothetical protein